MDVSKLTKAYVAIRDKRAEIKKLYDTEDALLKEHLTKLEAQFLRVLQMNNSESMRTEFGTVFRQEEMKPSCQDWAILDQWMESTPDVNPSDVLEKRLSKAFVKEYMTANDGNLPPGVSVYREFVARVRRN